MPVNLPNTLDTRLPKRINKLAACRRVLLKPFWNMNTNPSTAIIAKPIGPSANLTAAPKRS